MRTSAAVVGVDKRVDVKFSTSQLTEPLHVTTLLLYEFRQSARWQVFLQGQDRRKGYAAAVAEKALADLQANLTSGAVVIVPADWTDVYAIAERLSAQYT